MAYPGPPYPPSPAPGSNAISQFQVGVSPIGTIATFNVWTTIISQYADSPVLTGMIESFNAAMDQTENLDDFYDLVWNVATAQSYGLDVWGRIVGVARSLPIVVAGSATFGFNEPGNDWGGFGQAPFTSSSGPTSTITLTDLQFRPVVLAKAATNVWDGSIPGINSILLGLFAGRGTPYVMDGNNMSLTYVFPFALSALDTAIIEQSGALPQPCGVVINTLIV